MPSRLKKKLTDLWYAGLAKEFPIYFIISTGRTGTKFFESFLGDATDDAYCLHEPWPDLFDLGVGLYRGKFTEEEVIKELRASRIPLLRKAKALRKRVYVESNPNAALLLPQIRKAFPNHRVVWITRDIKTYLPSAYNKSPDDSGSMFFYADDDHRKRLTALDIKSDPWHAEWPRFSRAERIAWWWQTCNSLLRDQTKNDSRCLHLKFETIFNAESGPDEMAKILEFFGFAKRGADSGDPTLKALHEPKNQTRHSAENQHGGLAMETDSRVDEITKRLRAELGYGND